MQGFLFIGLGFEFESYGLTVDAALANYSDQFKLTDFRAIFKL